MKFLASVLMALFSFSVAQAQSSTPQPLPLPTQQMLEQLATVNAQLDDVPIDLANPDGLPLLPSDDGRQLFGYIKWMLNPAMADEWAGPLAPIFSHIGIGLGMMFALMGIYGVIYIVANVGGWVNFLTHAARQIIDLVLQMIQGGWPALALGAILFIAFLLFGQEAVTEWLGERLNEVLDWIYEIAGQITGGA